jgi:hypothetical protein
MFKGHINELDKAHAEALVGKTIGVAVTYVGHNGTREERRWHGRISSAEPPNKSHAGLVHAAMQGAGDWCFCGHDVLLPPTPEQSAVCFRETGAYPDCVIAYEIALPDPSIAPRATPDSERNLSGMMREYMAAAPTDRQMLGEVIASYWSDVWGHFHDLERAHPRNYDELRCLDDLFVIVAVGPREDPRDITHFLDAVIRACAALPHEVVRRCYDKAASAAEVNGSVWLAERIRGYPSAFWRGTKSPQTKTGAPQELECRQPAEGCLHSRVETSRGT